MTVTVTLLSDPDAIVETLSPIRRRLLALLTVPDSATGLANQLGATRQLVNYHLRTLEAAGLVEVAETRRRRGLTENVMRRTTDVILVDPGAFDTSGLARSDVVGITGVVSLATDLIRRAAKVATQAGRGERVAAASLDRDPCVEPGGTPLPPRRDRGRRRGPRLGRRGPPASRVHGRSARSDRSCGMSASRSCFGRRPRRCGEA